MSEIRQRAARLERAWRAALLREDALNAQIRALKRLLRFRERQIREADEHLERAIEWFPRPREVVIGDAQLARAALRRPVAKRGRR